MYLIHSDSKAEENINSSDMSFTVSLLHLLQRNTSISEYYKLPQTTEHPRS